MKWVSLVTTGISGGPQEARNAPSGKISRLNAILNLPNFLELIINVLFRKKRKFELARPPAMTKLAPQRIHTLRTRGGNKKYRALR